MSKLNIRVIEVENGFYMIEGDPFHGRAGNREWVARSLEDLLAVVEDLARDSDLIKKSETASE